MSNVNQSSGDIELVTPSDSVGFDRETRGVSFAVSGDISVICADTGDTVVIPSGSISSGFIAPIRVTRVNAAGTTATGIVAYF